MTLHRHRSDDLGARLEIDQRLQRLAANDEQVEWRDAAAQARGCRGSCWQRWRQRQDWQQARRLEWQRRVRLQEVRHSQRRQGMGFLHNMSRHHLLSSAASTLQKSVDVPDSAHRTAGIACSAHLTLVASARRRATSGRRPGSSSAAPPGCGAGWWCSSP